MTEPGRMQIVYVSEAWQEKVAHVARHGPTGAPTRVWWLMRGHLELSGPGFLTWRTWPGHDEPGCEFCGGPAHRPVTMIWGMPAGLCPAMGPDEWRIVT